MTTATKTKKDICIECGKTCPVGEKAVWTYSCKGYISLICPDCQIVLFGDEQDQFDQDEMSLDYFEY